MLKVFVSQCELTYTLEFYESSVSEAGVYELWSEFSPDREYLVHQSYREYARVHRDHILRAGVKVTGTKIA
jgi:hypothetical protein